MSLSFKNVYATAKISSRHALDQDFIVGMASNTNADYVYRGAKDSVIVNFGAIGTSWDSVQGTLRAHGWDSDCIPGLLPLFKILVGQGIFSVELSEEHPKLRWAEWFTADTFMHIKPVSYESQLYSINELRGEQLAEARKRRRRSGEIIDRQRLYFILGGHRVLSIEDMRRFELVEPEEISHDYDGYVDTDDGLRIAIKILDGKVNVGQILN